MTPKPRLSSHLMAEATPEEISQQWAAIEARISRRPKQWRMLPLSLALVGVASAAVILVATHRTPSERSWTSGNEPLPIALDDGSLVRTDNDLELRIPPGLDRNHRVRVTVTSAAPLRGEVVA